MGTIVRDIFVRAHATEKAWMDDNENNNTEQQKRAATGATGAVEPKVSRLRRIRLYVKCKGLSGGSRVDLDDRAFMLSESV